MKLILTILIFGIVFVSIIILIYYISKNMYVKQFKKKKYDVQDEMNFFNDAKWVEKVINSCNTLEQLYVCDKLIKTLLKKYKNKVNHFDLSLIDDNLNSQWFLKSALI